MLIRSFLAVAAFTVLAGCASDSSGSHRQTSDTALSRAPVAATRTFAAPIEDVRRASMRALDRMDIAVIDDQASPLGWRIAAGDSPSVAIELVPLGANVTRMRVVADHPSVAPPQYAQTASEVLAQTGKTMRDVRRAQPGFIQSRWRWSETRRGL
jgi:hypothetical protein